ncbi:MAG: PilZ domain-containing protein, partial [Nitrospirae bacterium]|nr:PilZ domain-containing protein [Nitrospirota bacterium]
MSEQPDQRDLHRVDQTIFARFGIDYPEYKGEVINLSPGGLLIRSQKLFPVDTLLVIELRFPGDRSALVRGEVVRTPTEDPVLDGMGINLSTVSEEYLAYLKSF